MLEYIIIIFIYLGEENFMCWGIGYYLFKVFLGIFDIGVVNDGIFCGMNWICVNRICVDSLLL